MNKKLLKFIQDFSEMKEGFTFRVEGRGIRVPVTGYAVSVTPLIGIETDPNSIIGYILKNKKIKIDDKKYNLFVGGWYDYENDEYCLDLSLVFDDLNEAMELAIKCDQRYIYDLSEEQDIKVQ